MATLQIVEFQDAQNDNQIPVAKTWNGLQNVVYAAAASSAAMSEGTKLIRLISDAAAYITFDGTTATAANGLLLPADTVEYFGVEKGQVLSVYDGTT